MSLLDNASLLITPNAYKASKLYSVIPTNGNGDLTFTRATTATRINSSGLVESSALNVPRLDYSLGGCPSLLLEPQRTNLALRSQEFDNASWVKVNASVTANTTTSPDGTSNADSLVENTATNLHLTYQFFTSTATTYTYSCYIKPDTRTRAYLRTDTSAGTTRTLFDLTGAGSVVTLAHTSATITLVGNGWYRCTITFTEGTGAANRLFAVEGAVGTSISYAGNGLTAFYLYGAQLEAGAYATSYIPTTSASVTRNADVITRNNIYTNGLISASGGTWFVDIKNNIDLIRNGSSGGIFINTGTVALGGSGFLFRNPTSSSQKISIVKYISGTASTLYDTLTTDVKAVIKWNGTTADVFVNGVKVVTATAFTTTAMENLIAEGNNRNLNISTMLLAPTPLTDAECIALTTI